MKARKNSLECFNVIIFLHLYGVSLDIKKYDNRNLQLVVLNKQETFQLNIVKASSIEPARKGWIIYWKTTINNGEILLNNKELLNIFNHDDPLKKVEREIKNKILELLKLAKKYDAKKIPKFQKT